MPLVVQFSNQTIPARQYEALARDMRQPGIRLDSRLRRDLSHLGHDIAGLSDSIHLA
jgi:hypothetical protein